MQTELETHVVATRDGWSLRLIRLVRPGVRSGPPVLFVPGYGMNAWIVQFHPSGRSFAHVLLEAGLDPWGVDLRGTSTSRPIRPHAGPVSLDAQARVDLPTAIGFVRRHAGHPAVHAIGCSLGGSLLYGHLALADDPGLDRFVAIGAPLAWAPSLQTRALSRLLRTVGRVPLRGTQRLARQALPVLARVAPELLKIYLNPRITDVAAAAELTRTVEDPIPSINVAIGAWMRRELWLGGEPVAPRLKRYEGPMLVMYGSGDGIVPRDSALSVVGATGGPVEVAEITHPTGEPVGHADLFVSDIAPRAVFERAARFLG